MLIPLKQGLKPHGGRNVQVVLKNSLNVDSIKTMIETNLKMIEDMLLFLV